MNRLLSLALAFAFFSSVHGQALPQEFNWNDAAKTNASAQVISAEGRAALEIRHTEDAPLQLTLLVITNPPIASPAYAVRGEVQYENVREEGYLEMWSYFPAPRGGGEEARYFSRTLGASGEMGKLRGTSGWRPFSLPFYSQGASGPPTKLEINLVLKGGGLVRLGPLRLTELDQPIRSPVSGAWWSERTGGIIGGIAGALLGITGGLMGSLASKGKGRAFVMGACAAMIGLGAAAAVMVPVAFWQQQPRGVWLIFLLFAGIILPIMPARLRGYRAQYEEIELRRIASEG